MLRPLTRSSGQFGRNTRHSSKKSPYPLKNKNHVATNHRGTPQIRRSISRKSICESKLIKSKPKLALSVASSKGKRLSNELNGSINVPKTSICRLRSQSENILETPVPKLRKKSTLIKSFQDESPLNIRKRITEINKQSISTDFKRVTRSSMGNIEDRNLIKNRSRESGLAISTLPKSPKKNIKIKKNVKQLNMTNDESKRMTCSSFGEVSFIKSRSSKDELVNLNQSKEKHVKSKNIKEKHANVSSSLIKALKDHLATSSMWKNAELPINSKHMASSSFQTITDFTPLVRKLPKDKILVSPSPLTAQVRVGRKKNETEGAIIQKISGQMIRRSMSNITSSLKSSERNSETILPLVKKLPKRKILVSPSPLSAQVVRKKSEKEVFTTQKGSEQMELCNLSNVFPLESTERESENRRKTRNSSPTSVSRSRKAAVMKSVESTSVTLMHNTRISNSRSSPARQLPKRNCKSSTVSKGVKRKPTESPQKDKRKNSTLKTPVSTEGSIPLDCLTIDIPNKRLRRHTVDVCIKNKTAPNPSSIQEKTKKASSPKLKTKSAKPKKANDSSLKQSSMSSSGPDMSQSSLDCLTTFRADTKSSKKRPKSAPGAIKRKSKVAGLRTPIPKKGTLKRKRWMFKTLTEKNEGYEDDIFENQKLQTPAFRIFNAADDESDSSIATPKFGFLLTPAVPKKTPTFKETMSPSDLLLARKNAEEYLFRRNRKRTSGHSTLNSPSQSQKSVASDEVPEKKKLEFTEVLQKVETICKDLEEKIQDESEEEDDYFTEEVS